MDLLIVVKMVNSINLLIFWELLLITRRGEDFKRTKEIEDVLKKLKGRVGN